MEATFSTNVGIDLRNYATSDLRRKLS